MNNDPSEHQQNFSGEANSEERVRKVQLFHSSRSQFGVFEDEVATIAEWRLPTPLPSAPESVLGVVSIQGRMLTVLDLTLLAGENSAADNFFRHIIALRGDEQLALAVTKLDETIEYSGFDSENTVRNNERFVLKVLTVGGSEVRLLNVPELFPAALQGRERRRRRF